MVVTSRNDKIVYVFGWTCALCLFISFCVRKFWDLAIYRIRLCGRLTESEWENEIREKNVNESTNCHRPWHIRWFHSVYMYFLSFTHAPSGLCGNWFYTEQNSIVSTECYFFFLLVSCSCYFFYENLNDEIAHCTRSEWKIMLQGFSYTY